MHQQLGGAITVLSHIDAHSLLIAHPTFLKQVLISLSIRAPLPLPSLTYFGRAFSEAALIK